MTRKDFQLIAGVLSKHISHWESEKKCLIQETQQVKAAASEWAVRDIAIAIAGELGDTNPRFDKERFLSACGINATI